MQLDIFGPYDNGMGGVLFGDPFDVDLALREALGADPEDVRKRTTDPDPGKATAAKRQLVAAIRTAFKLAPFDPATGKGATSTWCMTVWNMWADYCVKKNGKPASAPISPCADSAPSTSSDSVSASASGFGFTSAV